MMYLMFAMVNAACVQHGLPHRPVDQLTNWGQGRTPQANVCPPGTFRFETDDGLFLECFRGR